GPGLAQLRIDGPPGLGVLGGVGEHRLVGPAVDPQVTLFVAVAVGRPHRDRARDDLLAERGAHDAAVRLALLDRAPDQHGEGPGIGAHGGDGSAGGGGTVGAMYVVMNSIAVDPEHAEIFEQHFSRSMDGTLGSVGGLVRSTLLRPVTAGEPYVAQITF